jgi:Domain of unknown function (DUF222)
MPLPCSCWTRARVLGEAVRGRVMSGRPLDRASEERDDQQRFLNRQLTTWVDDDGMVVIRGRLTPEVGAVVQRALEAAADRLFRQSRHCPVGDAPEEDVTPAQRCADTLGLFAARIAVNIDAANRRYIHRIICVE